MTADADLTKAVRDQHEDAVRTGIGMCIRLAELEIEAMNRLADVSAQQVEVLAKFRDLMRTMSAEFSLDAAGA